MVRLVKALILVLMVLGASSHIFAQQVYFDGVRKVRVYISPMKDGTEDEKVFFMTNIDMELVASGYEVVRTREESDFFLELGLGRDEEEAPPVNYLNMTLFNTYTETEIVSVSQNYHNVEEMYTWNLYLITQAMANAADVLKGIVTGVGGGYFHDTPDRINDFLNRRLVFGLRGGLSLGWYSLSSLSYQDSSLPQATDFEFGFSGAFRFFTFFSVQVEAVFERGTMAFRMGSADSSLVHYTDTYTGYSLLFPVTAKFSLNLNPFLFSAYGGIYYRLGLGKLGFTSNNPNMADKSYEYGPPIPLGFTAGLEAGFSLGPGILFFDLRYGKDLSMTVVQNDEGLRYSRDWIGVSVGYQFAIRPKKPKAAKGTVEAERQTEVDDGAE